MEMEGKEVFLLISDRNVSDTPTTSLAFMTQDELNTALVTESYGNPNTDEVEVFHGVLMSPKYIPESLGGCTPYIMIHNSEDLSFAECTNEVMFIKGPPDVNRLITIIEGFVNKKIFKFGTYPKETTIEDIQIFFGHQIPLILQMDEDHLDEELISRVLKISDKVKELKISNYGEKVNEINS